MNTECHRDALATRVIRKWSGGGILAACLCALSGVASPVQAAADLRYNVTFNDPLGLGAAYYVNLDSHIGAALDLWSVHLIGSADIHVLVDISWDTPRATGRSLAAGFVRSVDGLNIYEQGMAYELRTGLDINGALPDVEFTFNPGYLSDELWFDPNPRTRMAPIAPNRTDAMSVILHEFGHALAFNGWSAPHDGALPGTYASTWDELVSFDGEGLYFMGPQAQSIPGDGVAITTGSNFHVGNASGPGEDLIHDLMNGVAYYREQRYNISSLDLAMLKDMGVPVSVVPEPTSLVLALVGLAAVGLQGRRRRH